MREDRLSAIRESEELLIGAFPVFLKAFVRKPAFSRPVQLQTHLRTIGIRRRLGSAAAAATDPEFLDALYETLRAWGIGLRGSRLTPVAEFRASLKAHKRDIAALDAMSLDNPDLDIPSTTAKVWNLVQSLRLVDNKARLVPLTKALHHLLPDLVVPMDRAYTRPFFGWHGPEFQNQQDRCFVQAFATFARVARVANPAQYVGDGWNTSLSKVIDNAVVGVFVAARDLLDSEQPDSR